MLRQTDARCASRTRMAVVLDARCARRAAPCRALPLCSLLTPLHPLRPPPRHALCLTTNPQVFDVGGDVLQPALADNLCRLIAEQDGELHATAVSMFLQVRAGGLWPAGGWVCAVTRLAAGCA